MLKLLIFNGFLAKPLKLYKIMGFICFLAREGQRRGANSYPWGLRMASHRAGYLSWEPRCPAEPGKYLEKFP